MTSELERGADAPMGRAIDDVQRAAMALWDDLAAYAWSAFCRSGRGVVLIDRADLSAAARTGGPAPPLSYVPVGLIPSGDDFASIISRYDPRREVALLVGDQGGDEQLLVLSPAGRDRRAPADFTDAIRPAQEPSP